MAAAAVVPRQSEPLGSTVSMEQTKMVGTAVMAEQAERQMAVRSVRSLLAQDETIPTQALQVSVGTARFSRSRRRAAQEVAAAAQAVQVATAQARMGLVESVVISAQAVAVAVVQDVMR